MHKEIETVEIEKELLSLGYPSVDVTSNVDAEEFAGVEGLSIPPRRSARKSKNTVEEESMMKDTKRRRCGNEY